MVVENRHVGWSLLVGLILVGTLAVGSASVERTRQSTPVNQAVVAALPTEIAVRDGNGAPVITDGIFSPGEWDDAMRLALEATVQLYLKQHRGVVFIGIRGSKMGATELSLAVPGGPIYVLHVSAQLGEAVLLATGEAPPFRWGFTPDWYANEQRRDMQESARLEKEGKSPMAIIEATRYPMDGIEFAIRRSKFPGSRWLMRLKTSGFLSGGKPGMLIHPVGSAERTTDGWQILRFD